jgi:hypothetical protein
MSNSCASFELPVGECFYKLCKDQGEQYGKYCRVLEEQSACCAALESKAVIDVQTWTFVGWQHSCKSSQECHHG